MKYDVNQLPIVPYIIAERAAWNVLEADQKYKDHTPEQLAAIVSQLEPQLTAKFERVYNANRSFRMTVNNKYLDMRYTVESFMKHWATAILNSKPINQPLKTI